MRMIDTGYYNHDDDYDYNKNNDALAKMIT